MSKERLEEAEKAIKNNYPDERYSELRDALDYVVSQAEEADMLAHENLEIRKGYQERARRVQELEEEVDRLKIRCTEIAGESQAEIDELHKEIKALESES